MSKIIPKPYILFGLIVFLIFSFPKKKHTSDNVYLTDFEREILFANKRDMPYEHQEFILNLTPIIQNSNRQILEERKRLNEIISQVTLGEEVKQSEYHWLKAIVLKYQGDKSIIYLDQEVEKVLLKLNELKARVDIVPIRLALAQSAIESGWGKSRFCREGNAYFGIHCYTTDCGIKGYTLDEGEFIVKSYKNAQESVNDYMLFLNSKRGTQRFRDERIRYLQNPTSEALKKLARSIKGYSGIGETYHQMMESMLRYYIPNNLDNL